MKKAIFKIVPLIIFFCIILACFCSCISSEQYIEYYSQKENYIRVTGTVSHIKYNDENTVLFIGFEELSPALDDVSFKIVGDNLRIVQDNKIDEKLELGEQITFVTAPKYFGDGYVMPIVAMSINGETLLEFEEGYENLLNWLSE